MARLDQVELQVVEPRTRQTTADSQDLDADYLASFVKVENHAGPHFFRLHHRGLVQPEVEGVGLLVKTYSHSLPLMLRSK